MREIKFRAWDKMGGLWIDRFAIDEDGQVLLHDTQNYYLTDAVEPVLMQYTGLKDKNGKEIYEGDIVRILYTDWASKSQDDSRTLEQYLIDIAHVGSIVYKAPTFEINFGIGKYGDNDYGSIKPGRHGYIEVIGNIYENPELIKS